MVPDGFTARYGDLVTGVYDCVDRIVLNAYFSLAHSPGGFRVWWRRLHGDSDEDLDNAHLMRMAGRFSRRVRGWATAHAVPVIDCKSGERKHLIANEYLAAHPQLGPGVFLILVARASATTWDVQRSTKGVIRNLAKKTAFVNHYSFHILDPRVGARDDQDVGPPAVRRAGHLERPRARRLPRPQGGHSLRQGRQLLHRRR